MHPPRTLPALVLLLFFFAALPLGLAAYTIDRHVAANGAVMSVHSGTRLVATAGQAAIGTLSGGGYSVSAGFGHTAGSLVVVVKLPDAVPRTYRLGQNYPNPFNPKTTIPFDLPQAERVTLRIYDVTGRVVATLVDDELSAGSYRVNLQRDDLASGVYFYQLDAGSFTQVKRLAIIR